MNRLASEKSPYLLQHAGNPVDWYPWGDAAFARARDEDRLIFLSVGYSTCHWCHVMERESFEDEEVAAILNRDYVAIKVDREERPDVDRVYMTFVQATTGSGGWPMSVWLTPDLRPIYGATYLPPRARWGRPGFIDVLPEIARLWRDDRTRVLAAAAELTERLRALGLRGEGGAAPDDAVLGRGVADLAGSFDAAHGGFSAAPKFPRPSEILFLLREWARTGNRRALDMASATLAAMAGGGIHDHLGGGFHRYSVDALWRVPHFEKMLYDQAQLVLAYLEGAQAAGSREFAGVAAETLEYVERDMTGAEGGFYSAEDADSVPADAGDPAARKVEGAFYLWSDAEIASLAGADAGIVRARFGIRRDGNAPQDPHGEFAGRNVLYVARPVTEIAREHGLGEEDVNARIERARRILFDARQLRPRPSLDDKVLTSWNGLMIAAFARASRVLPALDVADRGDRWLAAARRAAGFLRRVMWDEGARTLLRRYRRGDAAIAGYADDYACLVFGLLELFQADGDPQWLRWAVTLRRRQDELFWDADEGGWFSTAGDDASVILRLKEDYDGAEPAASSIALQNLVTLAHLTPGEGEREQQQLARTLECFGSRLRASPRALPMMLSALSARAAGLAEAVIVGPAGRADTGALLRALNGAYRPFALQVPLDPARQDATAALLPFVGRMGMVGERATAFVCRDFACLAPATDSDAMLRALEPPVAEGRSRES
jgi:uncharacterized protein YyaL (SSP411 family)